MTQVAPRRRMFSALPSRRAGKLRALVLGGALLATGALLGLVPFLPGTPLVLLGLGLLSTHTVRGRWLRWRLRAWRRRVRHDRRRTAGVT
ncbi:MAG: hypothetical protein ACO3JL_19510, partial [Myxococcota bacterium]